MTELLNNFWLILCDTATFLLIGFAVAGVLHAFLRGDRTAKWLGGGKARSVFAATAVGVPIPLCSCSVLPAAITLRRKGADEGAVLSFLISAPETSATSVLLTYSLLGPVMAIYRPVAACVSAVVAGLIGNALGAEEAPGTGRSDPGRAEDTACCSSAVHHCDSGSNPNSTDRFGQRFAKGMRFAFVELFDDIFPWIVVGVAAAAVIRVYLPPEVISRISAQPLAASLLMCVAGVPLYVCAEASTPIAAALVAQGLNPGAALVFLLVGPATNIGALGVLRRELGGRLVAVYLISIAVAALAMGWLLDAMIGAWGCAVSGSNISQSPLADGIEWVGAVFFLIWGVGTICRMRFLERARSWLTARFRVTFGGRRAESSQSELTGVRAGALNSPEADRSGRVPVLRALILLGAVGVALTVGVLLGQDASRAGGQDDRMPVAVSILPEKWIVERVGGDRVRVSVLVQPGESPESYQPTDAQVSNLMRCDLYFTIGVPFERGPWFDALNGSRGPRVIDLRKGITLRTMNSHAPHDEAIDRDRDADDANPRLTANHDHHESNGRDPHIWLSPRLLGVMAQTVTDALIAADPDHETAYRRNLDAVRSELEGVDARIRETLSGEAGRPFFVFHPAWGYFADEYGLQQVAVEIEGKEPSDHELTALQARARAERVSVVFVQPQVSGRGAQAVARAIGGRVESLDPLAEDVTENLLHVANALANSWR